MGLVTPGNCPLAIPLRGPPALACGNAVLLKPSSQAPACAALLREIIAPNVSEAAFKVYGGGDSAEALLDSADAVSLTGSDAIGRRSPPMPVPGASRGSARWEARTPRSCSTTPIPLTRGAIIANAAMRYAGQKCTATSVIVVGSDSGFTEAFIDAVRGLQTGGTGRSGHDRRTGDLRQCPRSGVGRHRDRVLNWGTGPGRGSGSRATGGSFSQRWSTGWALSSA